MKAIMLETELLVLPLVLVSHGCLTKYYRLDGLNNNNLLSQF